MIMVAHWLQWQWANGVLVNIPFVHGVVLFFVLSGFLISRILLTNKEIYEAKKANKKQLLKLFYIRRALRIFPIYYLTILFLLLLNFGKIRALFPWLISYTSNIYQSLYKTDLPDFNHFWSLAVEEQFYVFWPLLLLFTKGRTFIVIVVTIVFSLISKSYIYFALDNWRANSYFTLCCMHALGLGSLLAYLDIYYKRFIENLKRPIWLYLSGAIYLCLLVIQTVLNFDWYKQIFDEFLFAVFSALIIIRASASGFHGLSKLLLENKFVCYSGKISYGLYIYHLFIPPLVYWIVPDVISFNHQFAFSKYLLFFIYYLLTFAVAHLSFVCLEKPINHLKRKFPYYSPAS